MDFRDISPYSDKEVNEQIQKLINNRFFFKKLALLLFPLFSKLLPGVIESFIKRKFKNSFQSVNQ
jgi:hypothetical protein